MPYYYSEESVEEVKDANDIVDVISEYITLKRSGANYKGLCPFHNEKTPSFMVSPSKQIFHCFGCGVGGNVASFIMKYNNLDFVEAIESLADRASISLKREETKESNEVTEKRERFFDINKEAARFFYSNLRNDKMALNYLLNRGISQKAMKSFGLGYAKDSWNDLLDYLRSKGFNEKELEEVGLIIKRKNSSGYYDRFRDRIMFPIINPKGKVIGFGGRVLGDGQPKYLNSPDSLVFSKGKNLYNLNIAKKYSRGSKIILVEGYMDVISLYNRNVKYAVASLGTALTGEQANLLKKYSNEFYICYDSDTAGIKATEKALEILKSVGINPRVILLPNGKDPDDYIKENGKDAFLSQLDNSLNYIDFQIYKYKRQYNLKTMEGKIDFSKKISGILRGLKDPIEVDAYIKKVSLEAEISIEAIKKAVYNNKGQFNNKPFTKDKYIYNKYRNNNKDNIVPVNYKLEPGHLMAEKSLLKLIIIDKNMYTKVKEELTPNNFLSEDHRQIAEIIYEGYEKEENISEQYILSNYFGENKDILNSILNVNVQLEGKEKSKALEDFIKKINLYALKVKKEEIKKQINLLELKNDKTKGDVEKFRDLCIEIMNIEKEIKSHL